MNAVHASRRGLDEKRGKGRWGGVAANSGGAKAAAAKDVVIPTESRRLVRRSTKCEGGSRDEWRDLAVRCCFPSGETDDNGFTARCPFGCAQGRLSTSLGMTATATATKCGHTPLGRFRPTALRPWLEYTPPLRGSRLTVRRFVVSFRILHSAFRVVSPFPDSPFASFAHFAVKPRLDKALRVPGRDPSASVGVTTPAPPQSPSHPVTSRSHLRASAGSYAHKGMHITWIPEAPPSRPGSSKSVRKRAPSRPKSHVRPPFSAPGGALRRKNRPDAGDRAGEP